MIFGAIASLAYGIISDPTNHPEEVHSPSGVNITDLTVDDIPAKRKKSRTDFVMWGRSPFVTLQTTSSDLILFGIIWEEHKPLAVINDAVVGLGERVEGNTVISIRRYSVILNNGSENFTLTLEY